jgi:hypothetical protein
MSSTHLRPRSLLLLAPLALVACAHAVTVGGYELDPPKGWKVARDAESTIVAERDAAWTWAFAVETDVSMRDHAGGPSGAAREVANAVVADDQSMTIGDPVELQLPNGMIGFSISGAGTVEGIQVQLRMLVIMAEDDVLVAIGFRGPGADADDDAKSDAMIASLRHK